MNVQIRGWGGSGKSTLVRRLIAEHGGAPVEQRHMPKFVRVSTRPNKEGEITRRTIRPQLWRLDGELYVLGNYDMEKGTTGGADYVSAEVGREIMRWYAPRCPHLVWESRNASMQQAKGEWLEVLKQFNIVWATLDTTATQGATNILEGRGGRVSDPNGFASNYRYVGNHVQGAMNEGIRCVTLNHDRAYEQLHDLLVEGGWKCERQHDWQQGAAAQDTISESAFSDALHVQRVPAEAGIRVSSGDTIRSEHEESKRMADGESLADELAALTKRELIERSRNGGDDAQQAKEELRSRLAESEGLFTPVSASQFVAKSVKSPSWAIENVWPEGAMGVIGGAPKNGKSSIGLELAVSLATGTPFLGLREQFPMKVGPAPVLYVQVENSEGRVQRDLQEVFAARGLGFFEEEFVATEGFVTNPGAPQEEWEVEEYDVYERRFSESGDLSRLHVLSNAPLVINEPEHQRWIAEYVAMNEVRYLFLDPLYMLTTINYEQAPAEIRPLLTFFTRLKSELGCATVLTHHQTAKHQQGSSASRLLGSTYIYGWYEAALFTTRNKDVFTLEVDALRELGVESEYTVGGEGIGSWTFDSHAQGQTDAKGRKAPRMTEKEMNVTAMGMMISDDPTLTVAQLAERFGVHEKTIRVWKKELASRDAASD